MLSAAQSIFKIVFFRANESCSKILNDKKYFNTVKSFGATLFLKASASCSKILNEKKYIFNTVNSGHTLFFRARASCSKILNVKVYSIQWKFTGQTLCFRASANCSKILNGKKYIQYSGQFHGKLFQGKVKKISIQYIHPVKAITVKFFFWENTTRKKLHPLELTSKVL